MILVIDNYDSFTYNLVHLLGMHTDRLLVERNDHLTIEQVREMDPEGILISPGPGRPEDAGISEQVIREMGPTTPILGVCLGHQALGQVYGGRIDYAPSLMHGKTSEVIHHDTILFSGVSRSFTATRYHSLVVSRENLPATLEITAETEDGVIMGLRHRAFPVEGIQFHPESVLTTEGPRMIANWLEHIVKLRDRPMPRPAAI